MLRDMFPEEMEEKLQIVIEEAKGEIDDAVERLLCPDHYEVEAIYSKYFKAGPSSRPDDFEAITLITRLRMHYPYMHIRTV